MLNVVKANGQTEPFSEEKLRASIRRAGINSKIENDVVEQIKSDLYENIPTSEIYNQIKQFLGKSPQPFGGAKYSLKQAIMQLGPTGYPFEDFIAEVLKAEGYKTQVRVVLQGQCVSHELDVIAEKDGKKIMVEAKFHNEVGTRTDVHVSLYTKARFDDLKEKHNLSEAWIATNTKMTQDAIDYAKCVNMKILSWSYPPEGSLRDLVEKWNLHPITQLDFLSSLQKQQLLENHVILCKDVNSNSLDVLGLQPDRQTKVLEEAEFISNHKKA